MIAGYTIWALLQLAAFAFCYYLPRWVDAWQERNRNR